jgi:hypothetical protein
MWLEMNGSCGKKLEERDLVNVATYIAVSY